MTQVEEHPVHPELEFRLRIDWKRLHAQKEALLDTIDLLGGFHPHPLEGIIYLLDELQDQAVEQGVPEDEVFGELTEEEEEEEAPAHGPVS
jgi:hypothetical protein